MNFLEFLVHQLLEGIESVFVRGLLVGCDEVHLLEALLGEELADIWDGVGEWDGVVPDAAVEEA